MTGANALKHYRTEHAEEMDRQAEIFERQAIEYQIMAMDLRHRALRLRMTLLECGFFESDILDRL